MDVRETVSSTVAEIRGYEVRFPARRARRGSTADEDFRGQYGDRWPRMRVAPLAVLIDVPTAEGTQTHLVVGYAIVGGQRTGGQVDVIFQVQETWRISEKAPTRVHRDKMLAVDSDPIELASVIDEWVAGCMRISHVSSTPDPDQDSVPDSVVKVFTEASRNSVRQLQALRYSLEGELNRSVDGSVTYKMDTVLADLLELSVACGRSREVCRQAVRAGLWAWITDDEVYHAQRGQMDPTLPVRSGRDEAVAQPFFARYDAAVRQCRMADADLAEEVTALHELLSAASTVAIARDAQAAETMNLITTVGGLAVGLPAIVIGLYSASSNGLLPFHYETMQSWRVLLPIIISLGAAVIAMIAIPGTRAEKQHRIVFGAGAGLLLLALIIVAGTIFPTAGTP